ncbi:hypothetical protein E1202_10340 [Saccharopolyspora karakumensis]|uniref:Uncharacterized protein n=1 Tax=Saccharopolyspora karakumensis TaxID=2530386 RepID=A0A4R5BYZ7_9PSEU|nr:hypothetical protein E1202_10340 [Saccharopolyspora karakumensis]
MTTLQKPLPDHRGGTRNTPPARPRSPRDRPGPPRRGRPPPESGHSRSARPFRDARHTIPTGTTSPISHGPRVDSPPELVREFQRARLCDLERIGPDHFAGPPETTRGIGNLETPVHE